MRTSRVLNSSDRAPSAVPAWRERQLTRHRDLRHAREVEVRQDLGFDEIGDFFRIAGLDVLVLLDDVRSRPSVMLLTRTSGAAPSWPRRAVKQNAYKARRKEVRGSEPTRPARRCRNRNRRLGNEAASRRRRPATPEESSGSRSRGGLPSIDEAAPALQIGIAHEPVLVERRLLDHLRVASSRFARLFTARRRVQGVARRYVIEIARPDPPWSRTEKPDAVAHVAGPEERQDQVGAAVESPAPERLAEVLVVLFQARIRAQRRSRRAARTSC